MDRGICGETPGEKRNSCEHRLPGEVVTVGGMDAIESGRAVHAEIPRDLDVEVGIVGKPLAWTEEQLAVFLRHRTYGHWNGKRGESRHANPPPEANRQTRHPREATEIALQGRTRG